MEVTRSDVKNSVVITGEANPLASLIWTWKPFLDELWAAAEPIHSSHAGKQQVWTTQVAGSLKLLIISLKIISFLTVSWLIYMLKRQQKKEHWVIIWMVELVL